MNAVYLDERRFEEIDEWPFKPFAAAGVYHRNSFYVFGGGGSDLVDGSLIQNHASDIFVKYTLGSGFECSRGSFKEEGECVSCPRGTFKVNVGDHTCTK